MHNSMVCWQQLGIPCWWVSKHKSDWNDNQTLWQPHSIKRKETQVTGNGYWAFSRKQLYLLMKGYTGVSIDFLERI